MATEVLAALIGILATVASGVLYILKREADSRATKTQASANTQITDAQTRAVQAEAALKDAEAKVEIAKAQETQMAQMMKMLTEQLRINEAWLQSVQQKEKADERNYQVLKQLGDDNTRYLSSQILDGDKALSTAINEIPAKIELLNVDAVRIMAREIGQQVATEVAGQIVKLLAEWKAETKAPNEMAIVPLLGEPT